VDVGQPVVEERAQEGDAALDEPDRPAHPVGEHQRHGQDPVQPRRGDPQDERRAEQVRPECQTEQEVTHDRLLVSSALAAGGNGPTPGPFPPGGKRTADQSNESVIWNCSGAGMNPGASPVPSLLALVSGETYLYMYSSRAAVPLWLRCDGSHMNFWASPGLVSQTR